MLFLDFFSPKTFLSTANFFLTRQRHSIGVYIVMFETEKFQVCFSKGPPYGKNGPKFLLIQILVHLDHKGPRLYQKTFGNFFCAFNYVCEKII